MLATSSCLHNSSFSPDHKPLCKGKYLVMSPTPGRRVRSPIWIENSQLKSVLLPFRRGLYVHMVTGGMPARHPLSGEWDRPWVHSKETHFPFLPFHSLSLTAASPTELLQQIVIKYYCHFASELFAAPNIPAFYQD